MFKALFGKQRHQQQQKEPLLLVNNAITSNKKGKLTRSMYVSDASSNEETRR